MTTHNEPSTGVFEGRSFVFPVRVYYEDTDFSGVVYHASYLRFMERGRSEFLREAGVRHSGMLTAAEPLVWAVRRMTIDYASPARVDEALQIRTDVLDIAGARMRLRQTVSRDGKTLVSAEVEVCVITLDGRARRIPAPVRDILLRFLPS